MVTCAQFFIVMLIFLNSVESELIYMENKGCHQRRVCDINVLEYETCISSIIQCT